MLRHAAVQMQWGSHSNCDRLNHQEIMLLADSAHTQNGDRRCLYKLQTEQSAGLLAGLTAPWWQVSMISAV